jgi:hypothetical protein
MPTIVLKGFKGEIPRSEPHLLPPNNAASAKDCFFDSGALVPSQDGMEIATMANNPAKGVYTEDGILFYSWPVETVAFNSPLDDDSFRRIYYLSPSEGIIKAVSKLGMANNGPTPTGGVRAGTPNPIVKPTLTVRDRTTLPDYPSVAITAESWWVNLADSSIVNKASAVVTPIQALRVYQIAKPSASGAPASRRMGARLIFTDTSAGKEIFSLSTTTGSTTKSSAVPGTVEGKLEEDSVRGVMYLTWGVAETRAYTYTMENTWNEESAAAPPDTVSLTYVQDVQIDVTPPDFTGFRPFLKSNIYRTFGSVASYIKTAAVQDGGVPTRFYDGATKPTSAGTALESQEWLPSGLGMEGFEMAPNGWAAAFKGTTLYMSEPWKMHAWPYSSTFKTAIRGIKATQQSLVVTTTDGVYVMIGTVPASLQQTKIRLPQPGIAQRSMVQMDDGVAYASNDGIPMVIGSNGTMEVSQKLFFRKKWRAEYADVLLDASLIFGYYDGVLVANSTTQAKGFMFRFDDDAGSFVRNNRRVDALFPLPVNDTLYYTLANKVYRFNEGAVNTFDWRSKDFIFPRHTTFGCGYIVCEGPVTLTLYADNVQAYQVVLASAGHFRLPDMNLALRWAVRLQSAAKVTEFTIARTFEELQHV